FWSAEGTRVALACCDATHHPAAGTTPARAPCRASIRRRGGRLRALFQRGQQLSRGQITADQGAVRSNDARGALQADRLAERILARHRIGGAHLGGQRLTELGARQGRVPIGRAPHLLSLVPRGGIGAGARKEYV